MTIEVWLQRGAELKMEEFDSEEEAGAYILENEQHLWYPLDSDELEICEECGETSCKSK